MLLWMRIHRGIRLFYAGGQKYGTAYIIRKHKMVQYGTGQTDYKGE